LGIALVLTGAFFASRADRASTTHAPDPPPNQADESLDAAPRRETLP